MAMQLQDVLDEFGSQFSSALEGMLGEPWKASQEAAEGTEKDGGYIGWRQRVNLHADPVIEVITGAGEWSEIGIRALRAAGLETPEESDVRSTFFELLTQSLSGLARELTQRSGLDVQLTSGTEISPVRLGADVRRSRLRFSDPGGATADLFVLVEPALLDAMRAKSENALARSAPVAKPGGKAASALPASGASKMDMLLDVELPVSVSFGRTQLALKDVIKLSTGSIIELNRTIAEPVEVIVNNCVVARGEVVVVEGNYGVRIQQIMSRSERLRSVD